MLTYATRSYNGIGLDNYDGDSGLDGCSGNCNGGLNYYDSRLSYFNPRLAGLGFVDPATSSLILTQANNLLDSAIQQIANFLGIGQGRREADLIVPTQNNIVATVLTPISAAVQPASIADATCTQLSAMLNTLNQSEQKWLAFLHDPQWTDGRASAQAEATLAPYFAGLRKDLLDDIALKRCSVVGGPGPGGGMDSTTTALILGAAVFLLPRILKG